MARGGINKALVLQARQELLRKGVNPSVDATRVQLGNTGSKTTICQLKHKIAHFLKHNTALYVCTLFYFEI